MGDYLNHVAARAVGTAESVRPRTPSLFEPPAAAQSPRLAVLPRLRAERESGPEIEMPGTEQRAAEAPAPATRLDVQRAAAPVLEQAVRRETPTVDREARPASRLAERLPVVTPPPAILRETARAVTGPLVPSPEPPRRPSEPEAAPARKIERIEERLVIERQVARGPSPVAMPAGPTIWRGPERAASETRGPMPAPPAVVTPPMRPSFTAHNAASVWDVAPTFSRSWLT